ncbi:GNAT family N-acetyltransferase [Motilimonas eburnea]|uniref:GNAT family N-acetyltransferase n=1 Tax=Motilimonas eburnea TaxID=1737488 RepID=UPI001E36E952|nr:GNAT family N-acetyltransferase [Motilimonas eburnea]MCE2571873.1 GNAT family N-acetyltransferase [Motilimonas eburnea]
MQNNQVYIKSRGVDDADVIALSKQCFAELRQIYRPTQQAKQNKAASSREWTCFGYHKDGQLVGVIETLCLDGEIHIRGLGVAREARRQGVARSLVDFVTSHYVNAHLASLWCVEQTGNTAVFQALGFRAVQWVESELCILVEGSKATEIQLTLAL